MAVGMLQGRLAPPQPQQQQRAGWVGAAGAQTQRQRRRHGSDAAPSVCCRGLGTRTDDSSSSNSFSCSVGEQPSLCARPASQQPPPSSQAQLPLLQRLGRAAAATAAAAVLTFAAVSPPPADAILANPRAPVARSADVALRRSIPAFNRDVSEVQTKLEAIAFKLRIPQRKPWGSMGDDLSSAARLVADPVAMLAGVLPADRERAEGIVGDIRGTLERLARAIDVKDSDRTSIRVSNALEQVAALELLQAPGLPYQLPRQLRQYPALAGRAVIELTVEKANGQLAFVDQNSDAGPQKRAKLTLVLDGYSAPITAAALLTNFQSGLYNNVPLSVSGVSVLAGSQVPQAAILADEQALDSGTSGVAVPAGGARLAPAVLPLEILPAGDFEPLYRLPLDVRSGELPVLPLSIYGAVAMAHLPESEGGGSGYVSGQQWFIYKFDKQQAGLAGLSFDEGEFGVVGYITKGLDFVGKLDSNDRIVKAEVLSGLEKLIRP